jgi:hypothetical protein
VQVSVDKDLAFSDVSSQIGDGMGDIIIGHGENGQLGDGTILADDSTGSLVKSRQIGIHITGIPSSTWHLFSGSRDFSQSVCVRTHISQDDKHVHFFFVSEILSSGKSKSGGNDTLDGWIIGQVHEEDHSVHRSVDLEVSLEESSCLHIDSHSCENNSEVFLGVIMNVLLLDKGSLSTNLGSDFIVRKTSSGEEGNLLSSSDGVHDVNSGDTSLDHFLGVHSLIWVNRLPLY